MATRTATRTQFLSDVLTTAVEGGIGYWSRIYDSKRGVEGDDLAWREITIVDYIAASEAADVDISWNYDDLDALVEAKDERVAAHTYVVTLDKVASAIGKITRGEVKHLADSYIDTIAGASRTNDAGYGDFDSLAADVIVQVASLGEVVYG